MLEANEHLIHKEAKQLVWFGGGGGKRGGGGVTEPGVQLDSGVSCTYSQLGGNTIRGKLSKLFPAWTNLKANLS